MNRSDWKGFEVLVADALGGKRRFRTMESYGQESDDVRFEKHFRKQYPKVKRVAVECKKRKNLNVHALFAEANRKYCSEGKRLVLASKVTHKRNLKKRIVAMKAKLTANSQKKYERKCSIDDEFRPNRKLKKRLDKELARKIAEKEIQLRFHHDITALVTVELGFFKELWEAWLNKETA